MSSFGARPGPLGSEVERDLIASQTGCWKSKWVGYRNREADYL